MSRRSTVVVVALLLAVLLAPALAADKVTLRYAYKQGQRYQASVINESVIAQETGVGLPTLLKQRTVIDMDMEVLSVDPDGAAEIKLTYQRIAVLQDFPQMKIDYDSGDPLKKDVDHPMLVGYKALIGRSITMKMSSIGVVKSIQGLNDLVQAILERIPEGPGREAARAQLAKSMDEEHFGQRMGSMGVHFPEQPVAVGDSWHNDQNTDMGFIKLAIGSDYKVEKITDDDVELSLAGTIKSGGDPDADVPVTATIGDKSHQSGTLHLSRNNPAVSTSKVSQVINMTVTVGQQSITQTVSGTVTSITKLAEK